MGDIILSGGSSSGSSSGGDGAINDGVNSTIKATVEDYANSNPLAVTLKDTNGDYVTAGGGTEYTEDVAAPADPLGKAITARRRDTLASETTTDGDWTIVNSTAKGELYVKQTDDVTVRLKDGAGTAITNTGGRLNVQVQDDALVTLDGGRGVTGSISSAGATVAGNNTIFASYNAVVVSISGTWTGTLEFRITGTNGIGPIAVKALDLVNGTYVSSTSVNGLFVMPSGSTQVDVRSSAWTSGTADIGLAATQAVTACPTIIVDGGGSITVDGTTRTEYTEDNVLPANPVGTALIARVRNALASEGAADGDAVALNASINGELRVYDENGYNITNDVLSSLDGLNSTIFVEDDVAPANPYGYVPILVSKTTPALEVADGDNVAARATRYGAQYVTLLDTSGSPVSVGGGTQYTEDAPAAANPIGTALNLVAIASPADEVAIGDNVAARGTLAGAQYVSLIDHDDHFHAIINGNGHLVVSDQSVNEGDPYGSTNLNGGSLMAYADDILGAVVSTGNAVLVRADTSGRLHTNSLVNGSVDINSGSTIGITSIFQDTQPTYTNLQQQNFNPMSERGAWIVNPGVEDFPVGAEVVIQEPDPLALDEGDISKLTMTPGRRLRVELEDGRSAWAASSAWGCEPSLGSSSAFCSRSAW